jgi:hypothetical protein
LVFFPTDYLAHAPTQSSSLCRRRQLKEFHQNCAIHSILFPVSRRSPCCPTAVTDCEDGQEGTGCLKCDARPFLSHFFFRTLYQKKSFFFWRLSQRRRRRRRRRRSFSRASERAQLVPPSLPPSLLPFSI